MQTNTVALLFRVFSKFCLDFAPPSQPEQFIRMTNVTSKVGSLTKLGSLMWRV